MKLRVLIELLEFASGDEGKAVRMNFIAGYRSLAGEGQKLIIVNILPMKGNYEMK